MRRDGGAPGTLAPLFLLVATGVPAATPPSIQSCAACHAAIVESYLDHGMSKRIGPAGAVTPGRVRNPISKNLYTIDGGPDGFSLTTTFPDGGSRRQRVVGRIGAGIFDTSWVTGEVDSESGNATSRLFFAPVETLPRRGLELAPFELHSGSPGPGFALTESCLTCHTTDELSRLPGASLFPANHLGADAFDHLLPLTCGACHGDTLRHTEIVSGRKAAPGREIGLRQLGKLAPGSQRDVCARCHLQGDARIDLVRGKPRSELPLAGQIPVLVPSPRPDDFRFVGQLERLALSACFRSSPAMTCTTCHEPHRGVRAQGVESFDARCAACHRLAPSHTSLTVSEVTGETARSRAGCVDCHVRRSQPFDLPHVRSADHFIQRRIRLPRHDVPHRQFADPKGEPVLYDDGRLARRLQTAEGRRWLSGVLAMGLVSMGRFDEAARRFDEFPPPGSPEALRSSVPSDSGLSPLETQAAFHTLRAMILMTTGRIEPAKAAFSDALALDPRAASALMSRARLRFDTGDVAGALVDTQAVIEAFPAAEQPWDLRVEMAERAGRSDLALAGLKASTRRWPSNAEQWLKLGLLMRQQGDVEGAKRALDRARALRPSLLKN
jgi:Tetratricopeptide repeat